MRHRGKEVLGEDSQRIDCNAVSMNILRLVSLHCCSPTEYLSSRTSLNAPRCAIWFGWINCARIESMVVQKRDGGIGMRCSANYLSLGITISLGSSISLNEWTQKQGCWPMASPMVEFQEEWKWMATAASDMIALHPTQHPIHYELKYEISKHALANDVQSL